MNFSEIAKGRYSCRKYDSEKAVETEKLEAVLASGILSPSACNGQPYHITVCTGEKARQVAKESQGMGMNRFATDAPVVLVLSEMPYTRTAAIGAKLKHNDYRSIDIGILAAYLTAEAHAQGLGSCILGWFNGENIQKLCGIEGDVRLLITLGYPEDTPTAKKRKPISELVSFQ